MSQFNDPTMGSPPPKKSSALKWVLIILGVVIVLPIVCCGIPGYFMFSNLMSLGAKEIAGKVSNSPPMVEHIGPLESANMNLMETANRAGKAAEAGDKRQLVVIDVQGNKGKGTLIIYNMQGENFESATLELPDGRTFPVTK